MLGAIFLAGVLGYVFFNKGGIVVIPDRLSEFLENYRWCTGLTREEQKKVKTIGWGDGSVSYTFKNNGTYRWSVSTDALTCYTDGGGKWEIQPGTSVVHMTEYIYDCFDFSITGEEKYEAPLNPDGTLTVQRRGYENSVVRACDPL